MLRWTVKVVAFLLAAGLVEGIERIERRVRRAS
jgi:hypothetical protein